MFVGLYGRRALLHGGELMEELAARLQHGCELIEELAARHSVSSASRQRAEKAWS